MLPTLGTLLYLLFSMLVVLRRISRCRSIEAIAQHFLNKLVDKLLMEDMSLLLLLSCLPDKECVVLTYINNLVKDRPISLRL